MGGHKTKVRIDPRQDTTAARSKARALTKDLMGGKPTAKSAIENAFTYYQGQGRVAYAEELESLFYERRTGESSTTYDDNAATGSTTGVWVLSPYKKLTVERGGTTIQLFAQIIEETSHSVSVEVFTQATVTAEAGIGIDAKAGPVKFSFGVKGAVQKGRKDAEKDEEKTAKRRGTTATRSFTIEKVSHDVLILYWNKVYYGVHRPYSYCSMCIEGSQLAKKVTYDQRSASFQTEIGLRLAPKDGGAPWDPSWPEYDGNGSPIALSAQKAIKEELERQKRKFAEEIASGEVPL
jgi:hypothetical protein